jgi:hypothetical protein
MLIAVDDLWFRLKLAFQVFLRASAYRPFVEFETFKMTKDHTLVLKYPLKIHCLENIELTSDKHVFVSSGQTHDADAAVPFSIWMNSERDSKGRPITK